MTLQSFEKCTARPANAPVSNRETQRASERVREGVMWANKQQQEWHCPGHRGEPPYDG
jgi:hypothetical protein